MTREEPLDLTIVSALLRTSRQTLLDAADKARGARKRRLVAINDAVTGAIGAVSRQGLSADEIRAWRVAGDLKQCLQPPGTSFS